jgi:hypothetical protein
MISATNSFAKSDWKISGHIPRKYTRLKIARAMPFASFVGSAFSITSLVPTSTMTSRYTFPRSDTGSGPKMSNTTFCPGRITFIDCISPTWRFRSAFLR